MIVITRSDISEGYQVVQSVHALADFAFEHFEAFKEWKESSNSIICLSVESEEKLLKLFEKFRKLTKASIFYEPDISSHTSIALLGTPEIRKKLSYLPLTLKNGKS